MVKTGLCIVATCMVNMLFAQQRIDSIQKYANDYFLFKTYLQITSDSARKMPSGLILTQETTIPFFCRKETQLERITKIPFRIRVGSLEQCDMLEGKN